MKNRIPEHLPRVLKKALVSFALQRALWRSAACLLRGLLVAGGILVVTCAFDRVVDVRGYWRLPATLLFGLILAVTGARMLNYLFRREDYDEVAQTLDAFRSDPRGYLRSLLDFARRGVHRHFMAEASMDRAIGMWQAEVVGRYIDKKKVTRLALGVIVLAVAMGAVTRVDAVRAGLLAQRFLNPLGNYMRPTATWIEVNAAPMTSVNGGDRVTLLARVRGRPVTAPMLLAHLKKESGATTVQNLRSAPDGNWQLPLNDVRESFDYTVTLGKARTAVFGVRVVLRPTITGVTVEYSYPKYTGLKKKTESLSGRTITALEGTKIKLDATCNVPIQKATATTGEGSSLFVISPTDATTAFLRLYVSRNDRIDVTLLGQNGLSSLAELPFNLRVLVDSPPAVIITSKLEERAYFENEVVEISYRAQDDIGITEVGLQAGRIEQAADLPEFGARQTQGIIKVPVSTLAPDGESAVKLKVVARDGKGQAGASRTLTLRVAVNSYDRQLRLARNAITGQMAFNNLAILGFPQLKRHNERLQALTAFEGTLAVVGELLGDREKPGPSTERQVNALTYTAQWIASGFDYVSAGHGRVFDWINAGEFSPRLKAIVGAAVCDSEVSLPSRLLADPLAKALVADNPKAALAALKPLAAEATVREKHVVAQLQDGYRTVQTELAGYLAEGVALNLARATPDSWKDPEFITSEQARIEELDGVLGQDFAELVGSNVVDDLHAAATNRESRAGLEQAAGLLPGLSTQLVALATRLAETNETPTPFSAWQIAAGPAGDTNRIGVLAFKLMAMARQERADSVALLRDSLAWLALYSGSGAVSVGASPAQESGWRLYAALSQARVDAEALRVGVMADFLAPGDPEFEFYWLRLRESGLAIRRLAASPELPPDLKVGLAPLVESLKPALHWLPQERDQVRLGAFLSAREAEFRTRLLTPLPLARQWLTTADQALATARPLLQAGVVTYRANIRDIMAAGRYVPTVMPMAARLQALQAAGTTAANVAETARLHGVGGKVDFDSLVLAQILLTRAVNHFNELILLNMDVMPTVANQQGMKGKQEQYEELDRLLGEAELVLRSAPDEATRQRILYDNRIGPAWNQEMGFVKAADQSVHSATNLAATLSALLGDRVSAAALWGELWCQSRLVLDEVEAGRGPAAQALARKMETALKPLASLPKDVEPLPEVLAELKTTPAELQKDSRAARDLAGVLVEMKPLARPVTPSARDVFPRESLAVSRARVAPAFQQVAAQAALEWTVSELEMNRRIRTIQQPRLSFGGVGVLSDDEFANLKLPKYLYLELKRAREQAMPSLFKDRCYRYLNGIMEAAR